MKNTLFITYIMEVFDSRLGTEIYIFLKVL